MTILNAKVITLATALAMATLGLTGCASSDLNALVAQGDAVSSSNVKLAATDPSRVKIYYTNQGVPKNYKVIGRVTAEIYNMVGMEHSQTAIAEQMKKQAASLGANGVINVASSMAQTTGVAILAK